MLSPPLPMTSTFLTSTNSSSPALAMYEAVISDPWASWGVADRIAELEMLLVEWFFKDLVEESTQRALRRARCGAREAEVRYLVEEGIDGTVVEARQMWEGRDFDWGPELIVE